MKCGNQPEICVTPDGKPCSKYSPLTPGIIKPAC